MAPSLRDIQLTAAGGRRGFSARDEDGGDLEGVRLLDSYDEEAAEEPAGTGRGDSEKEARRIQVRVSGMTCSACTSAVEGAISALPGVVRASVSLLQNKAHVVFDPARVKVGFLRLLLCGALFWCFSGRFLFSFSYDTAILILLDRELCWKFVFTFEVSYSLLKRKGS